jgi:hypothetical protein
MILPHSIYALRYSGQGYKIETILLRMNKMKKVGLALLVLTCVGLNANQEHYDCNPCEQSNHSFYGFVDGLYWRAYEDGLDYAITNNNGAVHIDTCGQVKRVDFNKNGGFRLGGAYYNEHRDMGLMAYWTRFHTKGDDCLAQTAPATIFPVWSNPGTMLTSEQNAQACVRLDVDMFDAHLYAWFAPTCRVDVMPMLGLAYAKIDQVFNINANGGQSQGPVADVLDDDIDMCNDYYGVGPKVGIRSHWELGCNISAFGKMDLALLYGKYDVKQNEHVTFSNDVEPTTFLQISCNTFRMCRPRFDMILGLMWQTELCERYAFDLMVGWEQLYFFGQNQMMRFLDDVNPGANLSVNGDLALQGLTVRLGFGF